MPGGKKVFAQDEGTLLRLGCWGNVRVIVVVPEREVVDAALPSTVLIWEGVIVR